MDDNFYQKFDGNTTSSKKSSSTFFIPFISGVLGATLVLGVAFGIPNIREKLLSVANSDVSPTFSTVTSSSSSNNTTQVSLTDYSDTSIYAAQKILPSIVGITVKYNVSTFGFVQSAEATGSGIIISNDGYILTNNHIINSSDSSSYYQVSEATSIKVALSSDTETSYDAEIIGTDELTDLAILKIDAKDLVPAEFGDSDSVQVGEFVLAVGSPLGLETSVTAGIVSGLNRTITTSDGTTYTVTQTDCAINSGNSGGALVNSKGQVIGINTLKISGTGIEGVGFAIPINDTISITEQLIKSGKVERPYIGISGSDVSESISSRYGIPVGVYVESIDSDGNAANSDLQVGDVITKIDGTEIENMNELNNIKNKKNVGDSITLTVYRKGETLDIKIKLGKTS